MTRMPVLTLSTVVIALCVSVMAGLPGALEWQRVEIIGGAYWRLLGGHLVHWSHGHLFWDLTAWLLIGIIAERLTPHAFRRAIVITAILLPVLLLPTMPELHRYRGISGLVAAGMGVWIHAWWRSPHSDMRTAAGLMLVLFLGKILMEHSQQACLFASDATVPPVALAHLIGLLIGLVLPMLSNKSSSVGMTVEA